MSKNKNFFKQQSGSNSQVTNIPESTEKNSGDTTEVLDVQTPLTSDTVETSDPSVGVVNETPSSPVVEETSSVVTQPSVTKPAETSSEVKAKQTKEGFTPVYKVELELTGYADAMDRTKSIIPEEGGKWQYSLFTTIKSVFNAKSQSEFNAEFNTILQFFNKNKDGIFNEKFIFRFPEYWAGSPNEFTLYRRIVYLIIQTADVKGRKKALEGINLAMVAEGLTEPQRNMLFNFYL